VRKKILKKFNFFKKTKKKENKNHLSGEFLKNIWRIIYIYIYIIIKDKLVWNMDYKNELINLKKIMKFNYYLFLIIS